MGATLEKNENGVFVMRVTGALRKKEMDAVQDQCLESIDPHESVKLLVLIAEDFCGWVGDEVWSDMKFFVRYGDRIEKIAIVGDPKWETRMLMFAGAGFRRAPVKYFAENQLAEAHVWVG